MVKNTTGGNKSKGVARKNISSSSHTKAIRMAADPLEQYGQIIKILGGSMCHVKTLTGSILLGCIRGKFRGRNQWANKISSGTWVLIGLHDWESSGTTRIQRCDILEVYNESDKIQLKNILHSIDWSPFSTDTVSKHHATSNTEDDITFTDSTTLEYESLTLSHSTTIDELNDTDTDINFDDL